MTQSTRHSIHKTVFLLDYENRVVASRCNDKIANAFNTRLFPEIEKAIDNAVPEEAFLEVPKITIDLGTIREEILIETIEKKLSASLQAAIFKQFWVQNKPLYLVNENQQKLFQSFAIEALEIFLRKGYFPHWVATTVSFEELLLKYFENSRDVLLQMLQKHCVRNPTALYRLVRHLSTKTFLSLCVAILNVEASWVIEYRQTIIKLFAANSEGRFNRSELTDELDLIMIDCLFQSMGGNFDIDSFSATVLTRLCKKLQIQPRNVVASIANTTKRNSHERSIVKLLQNLGQKRPEVVEERFIGHTISLSNLVSFLNSSEDVKKVWTSNILKNSIISAVRDTWARKILKDALSRKGSQLLLKQLYAGNVKELNAFLEQFLVALKEQKKTAKSSTLSYTELLFSTIDYVLEQPTKTLITEEFLHFLMEEVDTVQELIEKESFQEFLKKQKLKPKKLSSFLTGSQQQIKALQKRIKKAKEESRFQKESTAFLVSKSEAQVIFENQELLTNYLKTGSFTKYSSSIFKSELQASFFDLMAYKNPFFSDLLKTGMNTEVILPRIIRLFQGSPTKGAKGIGELNAIPSKVLEILEEYLQHFYKREGISVDTYITDVSKTLSKPKQKTISSQTFRLQALLFALSKRGNETDISKFEFFLSQFFYVQEIYKGQALPAVKSNFLEKSGLLDGQISKHLSIDFDFLQAVIENSTTLDLQPTNEINNAVDALFFYTHHNPKAFVSFMSSRKTDLKPLFSYLSQPEREKQFQKWKAIVTSDAALVKMIELAKEEEKERRVILRVDPQKEQEALEGVQNKHSAVSERAIEGTLETLVFYIDKGFLPWWSEFENVPELLGFLKSASGQYLSTMKSQVDQVFESGVIQLKFSRKRNKKETEALVEILKQFGVSTHIEEDDKDTPEINKDLQQIFEADDLTQDQCYKVLYHFTDQEILDVVLRDQRKVQKTVMAYMSLSKEIAKYDIRPTDWRMMVFSFLFEFAKSQKFKGDEVAFHKQFLHYLKTRHAQKNWVGIFKELRNMNSATNETILPEGLAEVLSKEAVEDTTTVSSDPKDEYGKTAVSNAGLIILWPFLTAYFERLAYIEQGVFKSDVFQNRAVYALQYLVGNTIDVPEYALTLNKILVGMPFDRHLEAIQEMSTEEIDLSKSLLEGLIHNWPKVHNSSPEAIQESFLQREGVLTMGREQFELKVEKKGLDILMHELSWNVSLIKLPWMQKPLHIDWI